MCLFEGQKGGRFVVLPTNDASACALQVELRLIAHLSGDDVLCNTLCREGLDPFTAMACMWQKCAIDEVGAFAGTGMHASLSLCSVCCTNNMASTTALLLLLTQVTREKRNQAKQLAYGLLYGMGPRAVGEALDLPDVRTAAEWQESFLNSMPGVQAWVKRCVCLRWIEWMACSSGLDQLKVRCLMLCAEGGVRCSNDVWCVCAYTQGEGRVQADRVREDTGRASAELPWHQQQELGGVLCLLACVRGVGLL